MPKSDAFGYKKNWGGVSEFSGFLRKVEKPVARTKKVPRYIWLGRSGRHAPWRPFEFGFREKIAKGEKVARGSKSFLLKCCFEGRLVPSVDQPLKKRSSATYRGAYNYSVWGG